MIPLETDDETLFVYTAISGRSKDRLHPVAVPPDLRGRHVRFLCYTDLVTKAPGGWELRPLPWEHHDPRRAARYVKVLPHHVLPPASKYSLWHDGSHHLMVNPWTLVDRYFGATDAWFATFKHPQRSTVGQEVEACIKLRKDSAATLREQYARMIDLGIADVSVPLMETSAVLRRHSGAWCVRACEDWWYQISHGSVRDQVSLPFVLHRAKCVPQILEGSRVESPYFSFCPHR